MLGTVKKLWERVDGRLLFVAGWIVGLATRGILITVENWVTNSWLWSKLFGWMFK